MKRERRLHSADRAGWGEKLNDTIYSSVIAKRFRRFVNWLYSLLINGFFGRVFTAYPAEEEQFRNSRIARGFSKDGRAGRIATSLKLRLSRLFEESLFLNGVSVMLSTVIHRKLKTFGAFFLSLGSYGIVAYLIREYVLQQGSGDPSDFVICGIFLLMAFPMMASKETFAGATLKSCLLSGFLFNGLGLSRDHFAKSVALPKSYSTVATAGMVLGALTYFVSPLYYVYAALLFLAISLVLLSPEIGVLATIILVPFCSLFAHPSLVLLAAIVITLVSFLVKLIRGKRVFRLGLIDFSILLFSVILLMGGVISAGGVASFSSAALYFVLLLGYFLTVNLIRTGEWVKRCLVAFLLSAGASALIGFIQIFTGSLETSWLDMDLFSDIGVRITSTFGNPNVYATYLLMAIPFAIAVLVKPGRLATKIFPVVCFGLLTVCMVETWSRGAWIGILVAIFLFFAVYSRRSAPYLLLGGLMLPTASLLIPESVVSRFLSIGSASDSSATYRVSAWKGVGRMLRENWLGGIGVGEASFSAVYPAFSYAGIEGIQHTHNLYLQILSETGVVGLIVFVCVMILFVQNCFGYIYRTRRESGIGIVVAGLVSVVAVLIMGLTDYVWYSYRVFLMFWILIGVVNAYIRIGDEEVRRSSAYQFTRFATEMDLNVDHL